MVVFFFIAFPALAVCVVAALYPELVTKPFAGSGKRRFTARSAAEAAETIRTLETQLAAAKRKACPNCHHVAASGMPTDAEIADSDRSDPAPVMSAKAPVDNGCRDTPLAAAQTARDTSLAAMALPGEEEMAAFLEGERAKSATARTEADTVTLPAVVTVKPLHEARQELEAWALGTAPPPDATATEVLPKLATVATIKVGTHMSEAS